MLLDNAILVKKRTEFTGQNSKTKRKLTCKEFN